MHNCGTDTIEGCLEEGLLKEALKLMGSFMTTTFYLPSNMITTLMNMLRVRLFKIYQSLLLRHSFL